MSSFFHGCGPGETAAVDPPRTLVGATVFPLADVARSIGGDRVRVDWILDLGDPLNGFVATSAELDRLRNVDLLLCDGLRSEQWAAREIAMVGESGGAFSLENLPAARLAPATGFLWLDPLMVRALAPVLADQLGTKQPTHRAAFARRSDDFVKALDTIMQRYPSKNFTAFRTMAVSSQFDALLDRVGIGRVVIDANPLRLSEQSVRRLADEARASKIATLLLPLDTPPGTVADIEQRTKLRVILLDSLGQPGYSGHATYLQMLKYNLSQLQSIGGTGE